MAEQQNEFTSEQKGEPRVHADGYMQMSEVLDRLGVSKPTLYKMINDHGVMRWRVPGNRATYLKIEDVQAMQAPVPRKLNSKQVRLAEVPVAPVAPAKRPVGRPKGSTTKPKTGTRTGRPVGRPRKNPV